MRIPLVAGNWKMNSSFEFTAELLDAILHGLQPGLETMSFDPDYPMQGAEVLVCPPFVYLETAARVLQDTSVELGAQNVSEHESGAFTGEISAHMLKDLGCSYAIVGHSERRQIFRESDTLVGKKFKAVYETGIRPILCVGETLDERTQGHASKVIKRQIDSVVDIAGMDAFSKAVIAYEPVWAIGTGKTATPQQAQEIHHNIREMIAERSVKMAEAIRILYGGSVKPENAAEIFAMPDIDGGLIGGASLKAEDFLAIINAT